MPASLLAGGLEKREKPRPPSFAHRGFGPSLRGEKKKKRKPFHDFSPGYGQKRRTVLRKRG